MALVALHSFAMLVPPLSVPYTVAQANFKSRSGWINKGEAVQVDSRLWVSFEFPPLLCEDTCCCCF